MTRQSELFDRAADCERLMSVASDPARRGVLKQLRDMWIALANESEVNPLRDLAKEIAAMDNIQASLHEAKDDAIH
ncbi:MAG TPA: hypothetical protein VKW08_18750 [Xanthobacteraceae bacterium]|jgi:hypothetical protein|nr:hypothetical protein [Xanthobacteraceae bacterium]